MRLNILLIFFALLCLPISSTSLTIVDELTEISLEFGIALTVAEESLMSLMIHLTEAEKALAKSLIAQQKLKDSLQESGMMQSGLRLQLTLAGEQNESLTSSFTGYKGQIRSEIAAMVLRYRIYIAISLAVGAAGLLVAIIK